jgi:hypothetical protein
MPADRPASSLCAMAHATARSVFTRYAVSWVFLVAVTLAETVYALLPAHSQAALLRWASTSVHNLQHDPVGCMVASVLFPTGFPLAWPALIVLGMFGANRLLGNWRIALTCAAGQIIGTLVSEGIVAYRVAHGTLTAADRFLTDVGPSYVVVSAIAVGLLYGNWLIRVAAALDLALLIFVGQIFAGLTSLQVSAVGHATAIVVGAALGGVLTWRLTRIKARAVLDHDSATSP